MASTIITPERKAYLEAILAKAEPYADDDPILNMPHHPDLDQDRLDATIAKRFLEGRL